MSKRRSMLAFLTDRTGAVAVEFALVSLIFLSMIVGTIDVSRLLWEVNACKAATRAAARYAIVNPPISSDLASFDAVSSLGLYAGDSIPGSAVAVHTCTNSGCSCAGSGYCGSTTADTTTFNKIVSIMQKFYGGIQASNVVIVYTPVGLGLAGNPYGPDVEPVVTVRLCQSSDGSGCTPLQFAPGVLQAFGVSPFNVPPVASSLSGEDLS